MIIRSDHPTRLGLMTCLVARRHVDLMRISSALCPA
ncbi:putative leader peptide [Planosporangium thailandense]